MSFAWLLSYLGANWALVIAVVLAVLICALVFWLTKNLWAVVVAVGITAAGLVVQQVDKNAYQRRVSEEATQQVKVLQGRISTLQAVNDADAERASEDAATIEALRTTAANTPANDTACLPEDAAKRVGDVR